MSEAPVAVTPHGPWTMHDVMRLPDDGQRYEIIDGSLLVSPPPTSRHQGVAARLVAMLNRDLDPECESVEGVGILLRERTPTKFVIPDAVVARAAAVWSDAVTLRPADVLLVVEVVSPSSITTDRVTKPNLLAAARIPAYWRVELSHSSGPAVHLHRLDRGCYLEHDVVRPGEVRQVDWPVTCRLSPRGTRRSPRAVTRPGRCHGPVVRGQPRSESSQLRSSAAPASPDFSG